MASTHAKALRRADVLQRLSDRLGIEQADLYINARGDKEMALVITLERIADAVEAKIEPPSKKAKAAKELDAAGVDDPLVTVETVEIVDTGKTKATKGNRHAD